MKKRPQRQLAVILHADVVGSTTLVQRDETLAHERMQDAFRRFSLTIEAYDGVAHELRGDALVAELKRASDAVSAALAFQAGNAEFNTALEDDIQPQLRVGISMGEVVIADNTVTGAGVVLAQRLEQLAQSGGVCIQGAAYETVPQRFPFDFESLGEQTLKGFEQPVRAFTVSLRPGEHVPEPYATPIAASQTPNGSAPAQPALELSDRPSIVVLPFINMSGDPEQEYFADGITEDIITELSRFRSIAVISRTSAFAFKGKAVPVQEIGKELGVAYVLEGECSLGR